MILFSREIVKMLSWLVIFILIFTISADQLRNRLEERRKSKDEEQVFVPDAIAADIQKAVKMANDNSKLILLRYYDVLNPQKISWTPQKLVRNIEK